MGDDELTALLDGLRRDRRRHPYAGRREYSDNARRLADRCAALIEAGDAATATPVLRRAVDRMTTALMYLDDSSGIVGDGLHEIMGLCARACAAAPPNPKTLAGWLVKLTFDGPGWPHVRLREFAPALGPAGLEHVANLVEHRQAAGNLDNWGQRFAVRHLREQLAELSGDVDRYVAELARNPTHADQYRTIATALRRADRTPEAIAWARRGLAEKGSWPNAERLRDLLVDLLIDVGDGSAALAERRAEFERRPTQAAYRDLIDTAARVSAERQQEWAMRVLTDRTVRDPRHARELVAVLLGEGLLEQAWQVGYSHPDQLPEPQWVHLLDQRRAGHPADVIEPYRELVEAHVLDSRDKHRYRRAIALLRQLRDAQVAAGGSDAFAAYLQDLRVRHQRRPTFLAKLDAAAL